MELNWSTFILEIVNFLVLVWLLKRFLYRPVLDVIARRRAGIEKTLADAETRHAEAERLRAHYEGRLADWDREQQQARATMTQDVENERARRRADLREELERIRETARVAEQRRRVDAERRLEETALAQGARFAARLLAQGAGPETEARLVELAIEALTDLPDERRDALRGNFAGAADAVRVTTAFVLPDDRRRRLADALGAARGSALEPHFDQDPALIAGVRIALGAWVLGLNVADELRGFAELSHGD